MSNTTQLVLSLLAVSVATLSISVFQLWQFASRLRRLINVREFLMY